MSILLAICIIGSSVFAKLPADNQPTLRQAIVAAGVTAPSGHFANINNEITGWSYECDGNNYAAAYFVANAGPADLGKLWIARYDDGKKTWTESSSMPPGSGAKQANAQEVITLFYDGYYLYVQLQDASRSPATLQFNTDLTYKREFFGVTKVGITNGALFYAPNTNALPGDPLAAIFDPDSGTSRAIFPPAKPTSTIESGEKLEAQELKTCGQQWFDEHGLKVDPKHPFSGVGDARSNLSTDSLAFAVIYGNGQMCQEAERNPIGAVYVYIHPDDPKRMRFVEQPITDWKHVDELQLDPLLTKESLAKLFSTS
ncbi:MAG TPA: hypothetical protein VFO25_06730 [Candidatus Eremiobacteraceae bacterium]|nr:hypothetical protein [Candidatus Eremiobacteraceae bacterium]